MRVSTLGGNLVCGWFLHAEPSRMKFGIIGLVVFIAAYVTSIVLYANGGVGREHQLSETMSASDGTTLTVDIEDIQSNNSAVLANLTVSPGPALLDPRTRNLKSDLSVAITSAATPTKRTWTKGMLPGVFIISLPIVGDVADWPFDRYRSGPIVVEIFRGNAEESERAPVTFEDSLPGWHVDMRSASKADPLAPYQLELHRSPSTAAGSAPASSAIRAVGAITARRPASAISASSSATTRGTRDRPRTARGGTPSSRTDSGGCSPGATEASTSAATAMISAGVR